LDGFVLCRLMTFTDTTQLRYIVTESLRSDLFQTADSTLTSGLKFHLPSLFELFTLVISNYFQISIISPQPAASPPPKKNACDIRLFPNCFTQIT
jgi:hypothetical protein